MYEVTIGIPVYNVEKCIRKTIESALAQTFKSIEFLIVDDCCIDSTMSIVLDVKNGHQRGRDIHIISQSSNLGVSNARNLIIEKAQGVFLFFMDSDDIIEPNTIELLMAHQRRVNADIVFGSHDKVETYADDHILEVNRYPMLELLDDNSLASYAYMHYGNIQGNIWNFCIKKDVLHRSKLRFINVDYWEDLAFMFDLVTFCNRAVLLPDVTYHYMCRYESLSNYQKRKTIRKTEILQRVEVVNYMKDNMWKWARKSYYPQRCYIAALTSFYVACNIIKNRSVISPKMSIQEIKSIMSYPVSIKEVFSFKQAKMKNIFILGLSKMPAVIMVMMISIIGKYRNLI